MVKAELIYDGNDARLELITHFGKNIIINCQKQDNEIFRLGGTAINNVMVYEGVILHLNEYSSFRAFKTENTFFEGMGLLSSENWNKADLHCYITEYYELDMEGNPHGWFISKKPLRDANHIFINVDILDGGSNLVKRYRVSPFTGNYCIISNG